MAEEPDSTTLDENRGALLRDFVAMEAPKCPVCAYHLAGLRGTVCPECGTGLKLQVEAAESRLGMWATAIVGLSVAGGGAALILGTFVVLSIVHGPPRGGDTLYLFLYPLAVAVVCLTLLTALAKKTGRRWFQQRGAQTAQWVVVWSLACPVLAMIGFVLLTTSR